MEVEFVACFEVTVQANLLRNFISGLGVVDSIAKLLKISCDNFVAFFFFRNNNYSKCAKNMELKYFVVKEKVQKRGMSIEHISIGFMIVDPLTKGLLTKLFTNHRIYTLVYWWMLNVLKFVFSSLCLCMWIVMKKTNYVIVIEMILCFNPL